MPYPPIAPLKDRLARPPAMRLSRVGMAALMALYAASGMAASHGTPDTELAAPQQVEFNSAFLSPQARGSVDLSRFERGVPVVPGDYQMDLWRNGQALGRVEVTVRPANEAGHVRICMTPMLLNRAGLDFSKLDDTAQQAFDNPAACPTLEELAVGARAEIDPGELRLNLSLPQAVLSRSPRGYADPQLWDAGVTGGTLAYTLNTYRSQSHGDAATHSAYLSLNAGFNIGDWHLRHNGSESREFSSGSGSASGGYRAINTYVERDLPAIAGRLTAGQSSTSGRLFDTQQFTGIQLASDERMLPDSQRGYAPVIRGVAQTNARVTVHQASVLLYDMPVAPGPFVIEDLYPSGYGGDLKVTITEGDGRVSTFTVAYASAPQLLRPGAHRYSLTAGTLRTSGLPFTPRFAEATYQRGLSNLLTAYGGVQVSNRYVASMGGVALGTSWGALSLDLTGARTQLPAGSTVSGASLRAGYSKLLAVTNSHLTLAAYRFSTSRFMDMQTAMRTVDAKNHGPADSTIGRPRNRLSLMLNQPLGGKAGQLYFSGHSQSYWNGRLRDTQYQIGYSNQYRSLNYSVSASRTHDALGRTSNQVMFNLSFPLGPTARAPHAGLNLTHDRSGTAAQTTVSGIGGDMNQWGYGASVSRSASGRDTAATVNGQYTGSRAMVQAAYGMGRGYSNLSLGVSGMIVAHPEGVTLTPYVGDTIGVISAPNAAGTHVFGYGNVTLDSSGHAVVPYLSPYQMNQVLLDPNGTSAHVELKTTDHHVAPHAGSIVMLRYETSLAHAVWIDTRQPGGSPLPFGAEVTDARGNAVGMVGQGSRIHARLQETSDTLTVRWGADPDQQCTLEVSLPPPGQDPGADLERLQLPCT